MADQTRKPKPKKDEAEKTTGESKAKEESSEMDELLDEIDEVLEANAEDFVRGFVQKGGELRETSRIPLFGRGGWAFA